MPIKLSNNNKLIKHYIIYGGFRKCIINISNGNFRALKPLLASGVMLLLVVCSFVFSVILNALPSSASSVSISVTNSEQSFTLLPTADTPAFGKSGAVTVKLTTDSASGYTFTVAGPDDNQKLTGTNSSNKIDSITSAISESTFSTDSNYNNKWGFLPSKLDSVNNSNYQPGPKYSTPTTIDVTSTSNNTANTYTFAIATKVDNSQAKDKYSTTFTLAASANATQYYIGYVEATTTLPSPTTGSTTNATVTLSDQTPTKSGYAFKGWCSVATTDNTCSGTVYQPGATYTLSNGAVTNLYAMWGKDCTILQNIADCKGEVPNTGTITMADLRDGKTYNVGKLADGNIWLLDNLALGSKTETITLTSDDTHLAEGTTFTLPASGKDNFTSSAGYDTAAINADYVDTIDSTSTSGGYKVGVYYNYKAASAGTITGNPNSSNAAYDICPKGWRLPTGGNGGEFQALYTAITGSACTSNCSTGYSTFREAFRLPFSGGFYDGSVHDQGSYGFFWSSTRDSDTSTYGLRLDTPEVSPQNVNYRYGGSSVRCIAQ